MTEKLGIEIDTRRFKALTEGLAPSAMQNAWRRTLRKTMNWAKSQMAREVSRASNIPRKALLQRLCLTLRDEMTGKMWLGLEDLAAHRLGEPRQTRTGVTAGKYSFRGAWVKRNSRSVFRRVGDARYPIERVTVDWSQGGEAAFRRVAAEVGERLRVILEQEIRYELHKVMGRA